MMKNLYTALFLLISTSLFATDYFWVGGTGNWSDFANHWATTSGGVTFHTQVPTSTDDVYFNASSFSSSGQTVTIDVEASCKSMDWTGVSNFPAFVSAGFNILNVYGSVSFAADMTAGFKVLEFEASGAGNTITTNGVLLDPMAIIRFYGGGEWTFQDNFNASSISLFSGTINTNNNNLDLHGFDLLGADAKILNLGSSTINTSNWRVNGTNITMSTGTSTINVNATFYADQLGDGPFTYYNVEFINSVGTLRNTSTFNTITLTPGMELKVESGATITMSNLVANGSKHSPISIHSETENTEATFTKSTGTVSVSYVELQDIHATGGATFTANEAVDNGNNTGWTINAIVGQNYYWVNNGGNWSDNANHWATTSGGATMHSDYPGKNDDVFFDANSFSTVGQTVTNDIAGAQFHDMDWTGSTNTPWINAIGSNTLNAFGSINFTSTMKHAVSQLILKGNGTFTDLATGSSPGIIKIDTDGTYDLLSDINATTFKHYEGTVNYNSSYINCSSDFEIGTSGTNPVINLGASIITCRDLKVYPVLTPVLDMGTSHLIVKRDLKGYGISLYDVTMDGTGVITGANTYEFFKIEPGSTTSFENGVTQTVNQGITMEGTKAEPISLNSNSSGSQATLSMASGTVDATYLILKDMVASGGATFNASQTIDNGNNVGWNITGLVGEDYYWVGNSGNWSDYSNHWATTSGGGTFYTTPPGVLDNVIFDQNSFNTNGQTVTIDLTEVNTNDLTAAAVTHDFALAGTGKIMNIYGSVDLPSLASITVSTFKFLSEINETLDFNDGPGNSSSFVFSSSGNWDLASDLNLKSLTIESGNFDTNDFNITIDDQFNFQGSNAKTLNFGTSTISANHWGANLAQNITINGGSSDITASGVFNIYTSATHNITLNNLTLAKGTDPDGDLIYGDIIANKVTIEAGKFIKHVNSNSITTNEFIAIGTAVDPIILSPQTGSSLMTISQPSGTVDAYFLEMEDVTATGGATFNAYNSINNGNVTGWVFHKADQTINFDPISEKVYGDADFALSASATSGLDVLFSIVSGPATIMGNTLSITGAGTVEVKASQPGDIDYNPAPSVTLSFDIIKADQVIDFESIPIKTYDDIAFDLVASGGASGNPVTFSSSDITVATISGNTVTIEGTGTATITANQLGNSNYNAAPAVQRLLTVNKADQIITIETIANKVITDNDFNVVASTTSGLVLSYAILSGPAMITGNTISLNGTIGTVVVEVTQAGDINYNSAMASTSFDVTEQSLQNQTITFPVIADMVFGAADFDLSATSSSGLAVSYTNSNEAVATILGSTVTIIGAGSTTITASQAGNENYSAAEDVEQILIVNKADQTITIEPIDDKFTTDSPFDIIASSTSGLELSIAIAGPATLSGNTITLLGTEGTVTVTASQVGNDNFNAAVDKEESFEVTVSTKSAQTITFEPIEDQILEESPLTLIATTSSGLEVTFEIVNGPATLTGNEVSFNGVGTVTVKASQEGDDDFFAASPVEQSFEIISITAINTDISETDISYFPNPVADVLYIKLVDLSNEIVTINLFDTKGRMVFSTYSDPHMTLQELHLRDLISGVYILKINGKINDQRIVIKN